MQNSIFLGEPIGATNDIPKVIYQTYHTKELIPWKVEESFKKSAPQFQRYVYNDSECREDYSKKNCRSLHPVH